MIFNEGIDRALYLILTSDKKNREQIANLIYNIPKDLFEKIYKKLNICNNDIYLKNEEITKAFRDEMEITSMYNINICKDRIKIKLSKWDMEDNHEEYEIELSAIYIDVDLRSLLYDNLKIDLLYVGNYFYSTTGLFLGIGPMIVNSNGVGYEVYEDENSDTIMQISDNRIYNKIINVAEIPNEIYLDDLVSKKIINKLVKKRGKW